MSGVDDVAVAKIAAGLTKAQRAAVVRLSALPARTTGTGKGLYKSATLRPLVIGNWRLRERDDRYVQTVALTPLGQAVRHHLIGASDHDK